jgi:general secretion pathway protein I
MAGEKSVPNKGFTLIEVLVALAILAIALAAAARASGLSVSGSDRLRQHLLASWVAQNRLAEHAARRDWPDIGARSGETEQGGLPLRWEERVGATPNSRFRRIEISVYPVEEPDHEAARLAGYLVAPQGANK